MIAALSKVDGNLEVYCYTEDEAIAASGDPYQIFDVMNVDTAAVKQFRDEKGRPRMRFETDGHTVALVNVTGDF